MISAERGRETVSFKEAETIKRNGAEEVQKVLRRGQEVKEAKFGFNPGLLRRRDESKVGGRELDWVAVLGV